MSALIRKLQALWMGLLRRLGRVPAAPALPVGVSAAPPVPPPSTPAAPVTDAAAPLTVTTSAPPPSVAPPTISVPPLEAASVATTPSVAPSAAAVRIAPEDAPTPGRGEALREGASDAATVRQFFARLAASAPGGLNVDFLRWETAKVERFFLAMNAPARSLRRGPAVLEESRLGDAFDGFQWD